tara:strand:- start:2944 stop:4530 length:1587 start_codon:yes stop_codon:yes gene_type:complete
MVDVTKIDSNISGLRVAAEDTYGVLPGTPIWYGLEPNSYSDFGGNITTVARETINDSRSRQQGVTTDVEASGGFEADLTQTSLAELLEGLFYAPYDKKAERFNNHTADSVITDVALTGSTYTVTTGTAFAVGDLVWASGFTNSANNGLKIADTGSGALALVTEEACVNETAPPALAKLVAVGFEFPQGDASIVVTGDLPTLVSAGGKNMTEFGIQPGEFVFIGGDTTADKFFGPAGATSEVNNGWCRVRSVTATVMTFDKTAATMVADDGTDTNAGGTGLEIRIFFGRSVSNKVGSSIVRKTYQLERTLGSNDGIAADQSEYITGAILNEFTMNLPTADKVTTEMTFVGKDVEQRSGATGVKSGTRPTLISSEAFNASSDVTRFRLSAISTTDAFPTATFAYVMEGTLSINNNNNRNLAIGVLGAFDSSAGTFEVSAEITAYFQNISALAIVRNNTDVSLDIITVKQNAGMSIDLPLLTLAGGLAQVELNEPIKLPLTSDAAQATPVDATYTHTIRIGVYDYLPDAAE